METDAARAMRLRYQYRRLILQGKVRLPLEKAARLIGPDCAYHLYSAKTPKTSSSEQNKGKRMKP